MSLVKGICVTAAAAVGAPGHGPGSRAVGRHAQSGIPRLAHGEADPGRACSVIALRQARPSGSRATRSFVSWSHRRQVLEHHAGSQAGEAADDAVAAAIQKQRESREHVDDPFGYCLPPGVPRIHFVIGAYRIVSNPQVTAFLHETAAGWIFRQVFTDGRPMPAVTEPSWLGYSVGRWDGDTFVVESAGFKDRGWLDTAERAPAQRRAAGHRAISPPGLRPHRSGHHHRRPQGLRQAVHDHHRS